MLISVIIWHDFIYFLFCVFIQENICTSVDLLYGYQYAVNYFVHYT